MKDVKKSPFLREMCKTVSNMYRLGWDERNGGNVSLLLDEAEVAKYLDLKKVIRMVAQTVADVVQAQRMG